MYSIGTISRYKGKKLVVLGGGESGVGAAVLGIKEGMDVWLSDKGAIKDTHKEDLKKYCVPYEEGCHSEDKIFAADIVVKSPGIPDTVPMIVKLREKGIPVISEIEFAGAFTDAKMICITGSNGKTTTTLLTYHILRKAGLDVGLAGNVGKSLAMQVANSPHSYYVIELSSFQLDSMYAFKADIAVILNITPDHMDRYDHKMENYTAAKFRILQNQTKEDFFIYWLGDPIITEQVKKLQIEAKKLPFSEHKTGGAVAWESEGIVHFDLPGDVWDIPREKLSLTGLHNLYNSMAAGLCASLLKIEDETIKEGLEDFEAVEHRLEYVATRRGARWINDSKATNVNSTWYALESMKTPTILILGGTDKGNDYSEIEALVKQKVKAIVCMGVDNSKIISYFGGKVSEIADTHSLSEAIAACEKYASAGDTVLLSPCCASFDLFSSYEDRGRQFKDAVRSIKE